MKACWLLLLLTMSFANAQSAEELLSPTYFSLPVNDKSGRIQLHQLAWGTNPLGSASREFPDSAGLEVPAGTEVEIDSVWLTEQLSHAQYNWVLGPSFPTVEALRQALNGNDSAAFVKALTDLLVLRRSSDTPEEQDRVNQDLKGMKDHDPGSQIYWSTGYIQVRTPHGLTVDSDEKLFIPVDRFLAAQPKLDLAKKKALLVKSALSYVFTELESGYAKSDPKAEQAHATLTREFLSQPFCKLCPAGPQDQIGEFLFDSLLPIFHLTSQGEFSLEGEDRFIVRRELCIFDALFQSCGNSSGQSRLAPVIDSQRPPLKCGDFHSIQKI